MYMIVFFCLAVAELVLDRCTVANPCVNVCEDDNYSIVYNYEFLEDCQEDFCEE